MAKTLEGRRRGRRGATPMAEINIIPLVDVVLVLLIIFMATTAFVKESGLKMQLPTAKSTETAQQQPKELIVALTRDGKIFLNTKLSDLKAVDAAMRTAAKAKQPTSVVIKGDQNIEYKRVITVMDIAKQAGLSKVSLGTRLPD
ncbi:biopolymer transport protein ExbD [Abditibacteriota bacterium]|nr:biopolymer transport protein ExbD [Abditibacteriota bacterium]